MNRMPWWLAARIVMMVALSAGVLGVPNAHGKGYAAAAGMAVDARTGQVYVTSYSGHSVSVLAGTTGSLVRTIPLGAEMPVALAVNASANRVFVAGTNGAAGGTVSTIDGSTGRVLRSVRISPYPRMVITASQANRAFVLSGSPDFTPRKPGGMSMLNGTTGEVLGTFSFRGYPVAAAVYEPAGRLFVAASVFSEADHVWTPTLFMRDAATGRLLRTIALPSFISPEGVTLAVDTRTARLFVTYSSLSAAGDGCHVIMLDAATGAVLHTISVRPAEAYSAGMIPSAITVDQASGRVFLASYDETTYAGRISILNAHGGVLRTAVGDTGRVPIAAAVGEDGRLVIINATSGAGELVENGGVRVLDAASGKLLYKVPVGAVVPSAVVMVGHLAFLMDAGGRIILLDVRSGRIVHTIDTGATT